MNATHERIVETAVQLLRSGPSARVSFESVASSAGLALTDVERQFGSRADLLDAVFEHLAKEGPLTGISSAMAEKEPDAALRRLVAIFCDFWASRPVFHAALEANDRRDRELEERLEARMEKRRDALRAIALRMARGGTAGDAAFAALVDLLFVLTGRETFAGLSRGGREPAQIIGIIQAAAVDAARRTFA